jgi:hypothetical protein
VVPVFYAVWALSNFAGPILLGRLFDTVGRKPMIALAYLGSAAVAVGLTVLFVSETGGVWMFMLVLGVCFFLASSGASAAYLTVSEIFPMETRALAIAFFYAVGTAVGGITGPLLFGQLIESGDRGLVAVSFLIGAAVMAVGGVVELIFGIQAEGKKLEDLALPLTADDAAGEAPGEAPDRDHEDDERALARAERDTRIAERAERQRAAQARARRYRPGPPAGWRGAWREPPTAGAPETALDHEIDSIARAVDENEPMTVRELHRAVGARYWGPGEFRKAMREALAENRIARHSRGRIGRPTGRAQQ